MQPELHQKIDKANLITYILESNGYKPGDEKLPDTVEFTLEELDHDFVEDSTAEAYALQLGKEGIVEETEDALNLDLCTALEDESYANFLRQEGYEVNGLLER